MLPPFQAAAETDWERRIFGVNLGSDGSASVLGKGVISGGFTPSWTSISGGGMAMIGKLVGSIDTGAAMPLSAGPIEAALLSYDSSGSLRFGRTLPLGISPSGLTVAMTNNGATVAATRAQADLSFAGNTLKQSGGSFVPGFHPDGSEAFGFELVAEGLNGAIPIKGSVVATAAAPDEGGGTWLFGNFDRKIEVGQLATQEGEGFRNFLAKVSTAGTLEAFHELKLPSECKWELNGAGCL